MKSITRIWLLISLLSGTITAYSQSTLIPRDSFPTPKGIPNLLFYIQRDPNTNTICYDLKQNDQGKIDTDNPIHIYWIRYPEGGIRKDLNFLQRKFAYGLTIKKTANDSFDVRSVAYGKLPMTLKKDSKNKYHIYAPINDKECILNRIFIRIDGGTFWKPNVIYIELKGIDPNTGKTVLQRIKPS
ncbi:MAG: DUF4833 domain-containing protein [Siphonobacter sp.]